PGGGGGRARQGVGVLGGAVGDERRHDLALLVRGQGERAGDEAGTEHGGVPRPVGRDGLGQRADVVAQGVRPRVRPDAGDHLGRGESVRLVRGRGGGGRAATGGRWARGGRRGAAEEVHGPIVSPSGTPVP